MHSSKVAAGDVMRSSPLTLIDASMNVQLDMDRNQKVEKPICYDSFDSATAKRSIRGI